MIDPTLTISIDRTALSLSALVCSGKRDGSPLLLTDYAEPAMQARVGTSPDSEWVHGSQALSWAWQQTILSFSVMADASTEAAARAVIAELRAAVTQGLNYSVTVSVSDADAETWRCQPGSVTPAGSRSLADMRRPVNVWNVTLPCYPVRS